MYAIIETGGKQYTVKVGDLLSVEKLNVEAGGKVVFDKVLFVSDNGAVKVGNPTVEGASVEAVVEENGLGKKVMVFKYKPKTGFRKKKGHRQPYTKVKIENIVG